MLKLPRPNVAAETHTVYLSYKGAYGPAVLPGNSLLKLSCQRNQAVRKSYLRSAAIALNYSLENIRNDIHQKIIIIMIIIIIIMIIIIYEKSQFISLVWSSLTFAPIYHQT